MNERINRLKKIAEEHGVIPTIRQLGGRIYANINGQSFVVKGYTHFDEMCNELKCYTPPQPLNLTDRLAKIEDATVKSL